MLPTAHGNPMKPINTSPKSRSSTPTAHRHTSRRQDRRRTVSRRRGSAMILAISLVIFLLLVGLSFLSMAQLQRTASSATARSGNTDVAVDATVRYIQQVLATDFNLYLAASTTNERAARFATYFSTTNH